VRNAFGSSLEGVDTEQIQKLVTAMTNNKGIGMTEGEWNSIVLKNKESFEAEAARRKLTLHQQREVMRQELEKQVTRRKQEELAKK
jgi:hypothetical protein